MPFHYAYHFIKKRIVPIINHKDVSEITNNN